MTPSDAGSTALAIDTYLANLAAALPRSRAARDLLDEARDHLLEASEAYRRAGLAPDAADQEAIRQFGGVAELAPELRAVTMVCDARRQATRQLVGVLVLSAWIAGTMHLFPALHGPFPAWVSGAPIGVVWIGTLLVPSLVLFGLTRAPGLWWDGRWLAWLSRARLVATWLFQLGLPCSAAMAAHPMAWQLGWPHLSIAAGALVGHVVAIVLVPAALVDRLLSAARRSL